MEAHENEKQEVVIACQLNAIDANERDKHFQTADYVFEAALEIKELANGYAFRLPLENTMLKEAMAFVSNERLCCPFFKFSLLVDAAFWLEISGTADVKDYIETNIVNHLKESGKFPDRAEWIKKHSS